MLGDRKKIGKINYVKLLFFIVVALFLYKFLYAKIQIAKGETIVIAKVKECKPVSKGCKIFYEYLIDGKIYVDNHKTLGTRCSSDICSGTIKLRVAKSDPSVNFIVKD